MTTDKEFRAWGRRLQGIKRLSEAMQWLKDSPVSENTSSILVKCLDNSDRTDWTLMKIVADSLVEDGLNTAEAGLRWCIENRRFPSVKNNVTSMFAMDFMSYLRQGIALNSAFRAAQETAAPKIFVSWSLNRIGATKRNKLPIGMIDHVKISDLVGIRNDGLSIRYTDWEKVSYERSLRPNEYRLSTCYEIIMAFHDAGLMVDAWSKHMEKYKDTPS